MTAATTPPADWPFAPGPARRRMGRALLSFGIAGLVLVTLGAVLVVGSLGAVYDAAGSLDDQRARVVALLDPTEAVLLRSAGTAENAGTSLEASARSARDAAELTTQLATAMDQMAAAAQLDVFGLRPFAALGDELSGVATRSRTLAADLVTTAAALDANVEDSRATAADLRELADDLAALRTELGAVDAEAGGAASGGVDVTTAIAVARIVLLGILGWLAVPALGATWLGWRWRDG
ncbi:MAG TPA: hypothetical protein VFX65_06355 [Candidatus Limnocylindrales bacterium]|nr:hypothetical protein [Candidatus Limnocylindrales bacterium]